MSIGKNVVVGAGTRIRESVILANSVIGCNSLVMHAVIGKRLCQISTEVANFEASERKKVLRVKIIYFHRRLAKCSDRERRLRRRLGEDRGDAQRPQPGQALRQDGVPGALQRGGQAQPRRHHSR